MAFVCVDHDKKYGQCMYNKPCEFLLHEDTPQCPMRHLKNHGNPLYPADMPITLRGR